MWPVKTTSTVTVATSPVTLYSFTPSGNWSIEWMYLVDNVSLTTRGGHLGASGDISDNIDQFYDESTLDNVDYVTKPAAPTAVIAATTGTNTAGDHTIKTTYVTANGETEASDASATCTVTGSQEDITVTVAASTATAAVTSCNVYMNEAGGSTWYLAASIATNGGTATVDIDDVTLATHAAAPAANTTAQADSTALTFDVSSTAGTVSLTASSSSGDWTVKTVQIARLV